MGGGYKFLAVMDHLNTALDNQQQAGNGGFMLGDFSAVDAIIPTFERWVFLAYPCNLKPRHHF